MNQRMMATILLLLLAGCATQFGAVQVAQYQHPESGETKRCYDNPTNDVISGLVINVGAFAHGDYAWCKTWLEQAGYVRVPVDAEIQAELDRAYAARTDSIRKK